MDPRPVLAAAYLVLRHGSTEFQSVPVRTGMAVRAADGHRLGTLEGIVPELYTRRGVSLLVCRGRPVFDIRVVPVALVGSLRAGEIWLSIPTLKVKRLDVYQPAAA